MSLAERAAHFNKKFKTKIMTVGILRRIYREQKIKMKRIKFVKKWTPRQPERKEQVFSERARRLDHMI